MAEAQSTKRGGFLQDLVVPRPTRAQTGCCGEPASASSTQATTCCGEPVAVGAAGGGCCGTQTVSVKGAAVTTASCCGVTQSADAMSRPSRCC
jgi:hypothetical protein